MKVGIIEILTGPSRSSSETAYHVFLTKQYASITPQAIAVWCRQLGHQTFYAAYYGFGDPKGALPDDLDVVFVSVYTQASPLAYALARLYRRDGIRTVIGGPHAKAYPTDCLRYFDIAVGECDKSLIADILAGHIDPGSIASSARPFDDVPTVEERMPEIRASAFFGGRFRVSMSTIPMLSSIGCPYDCDFCVDWNNRYRLLSLDRLAEDLRFLSTNYPRLMIAYHDPNFGVKFGSILDVIESVPPDRRNPYGIEASLTVLRGGAMKRLRDTNCVAVAAGVESWTEYSNKTGVGRIKGAEKVARLAAHFEELIHHVSYVQGNFMFGLDGDEGDAPLALTREFMSRTPFVWPVINIPHPFGGTPLYDRYMEEGRILTSMPFAFYYSPYLATTLLHYSARDFYRRMIDIFCYFTSARTLLRRLAASSNQTVRGMHMVRTGVKRNRVRAFRKLLSMLETDRQFCAFHDGESDTLPEFYHVEYEAMLGTYAPLIPRAERKPVFERPRTASDSNKRLVLQNDFQLLK